MEARFSHGPEGRGLPVGLGALFPHQDVEAGRVLVAEHEAGVVIVRARVHEERAFEVDPVEGLVGDGESRVGVDRLHNLTTLWNEHVK